MLHFRHNNILVVEKDNLQKGGFMHIQRNNLKPLSISYPLECIAPLEDLLFFDIETTGFSANTTNLFLIGCAYYENNSFHTIQWFADQYSEEKALLHYFFDFVKNYKYIFHYNGLHFDIPYLMHKVKKYNLEYTFENLNSIDIYKKIAPYKQFLTLANLKLKSIEYFLSLHRTDTLNGGQLIAVYHEYVKAPTDFNRELLLLHNFDDLQGMLQIAPILSYYDLFHSELKVLEASVNKYIDLNNNEKQELLIYCQINTAIPKPVKYNNHDCFISCNHDSVKIRVPIYYKNLKFFYPNYKDYYYLPAEDMAIHKSIATYVDPAHRVKATTTNCYTKKLDWFLPQWDTLFEPVFREFLNDKVSYSVYDEMLLHNNEQLQQYATHILHTVIS